MRILRVVSDLYPSVIGGVGLHAHELSRIQSEKGNEVTVVTFLKTPFNYRYRVISVPISFKWMGNSFSLSLPFVLWRLKNSFDIVHAHSHLFFSTILCAFIRHFSSTPLIITNHGLFSQTAPLWLQKIYLSTIGRWTLRSADRILCYTAVEKDQLIPYGISEEKIAVIHNGISSADFSPSPSDPGKQILWVGRFTPGKGVDVLLDAMKIFHSKFPDYILSMVGDGPLKQHFRQKIIDMDLTDSVILRDFIPNKDLADLYQESVLFVLPSLEEGVPRTILEAMSCGVPVVCTDLPQLRDIVDGCGILVPARDPEALADALIQIISDETRAKQYGMNGRERVVSHYSWDDTVNQTLKLYQEVIKPMREKNIEQESHNASPDSVSTYGRTGK